MSEKISAKDFVATAIVQGFEEGASAFIESLEGELQHTVRMEGIDNYESHLEFMIEEAITETENSQTHEHFSEVSSKIDAMLNVGN